MPAFRGAKVIGCGFFAALSACSAHSGKAQQITPAPKTSETAQPPSSPTSGRADLPYSFARDPTPPSIVEAGSDYKEIAVSLLRYDDWLTAFDPDPALAEKIAAPSSKFETSLRHDLGVLTRLNRRLYEIESGPSTAQVLDSKSDLVTVRYTQHIVVQRVVDRDNRVASERKFSQPTTTYTVLLVRLAPTKWRIADLEEVSSR
jgi:hypothetical protein